MQQRVRVTKYVTDIPWECEKQKTVVMAEQIENNQSSNESNRVLNSDRARMIDTSFGSDED